MRDLYQDWKEKDMVEYYNKILSKHGDPFYEAQENHNLIGVANVFLECLYHDVKLQYAVPIISQQGEVAGRLHVEVMRVSGVVPERPDGGDDSSENSSGSYEVMDNNGEIVQMAKKLTCRYIFWDHSDQTVAPPMVNPDMPSIKNKAVQYTVTFDHSKGQSRRIEVTVKPVQHSGTLPLMVEAVLSVSIGCITARSIKLQRPLDSYQ
eukprot:g42199.t1